jgi:uncharacterized membrane protein
VLPEFCREWQAANVAAMGGTPTHPIGLGVSVYYTLKVVFFALRVFCFSGKHAEPSYRFERWEAEQ